MKCLRRKLDLRDFNYFFSGRSTSTAFMLRQWARLVHEREWDSFQGNRSPLHGACNGWWCCRRRVPAGTDPDRLWHPQSNNCTSHSSRSTLPAQCRLQFASKCRNCKQRQPLRRTFHQWDQTQSQVRRFADARHRARTVSIGCTKPDLATCNGLLL